MTRDRDTERGATAVEYALLVTFVAVVIIVGVAVLGRAVHDMIATVLEKHTRSLEPVGGISQDDFSRLNQALGRLERFWSDHIKYRL